MSELEKETSAFQEMKTFGSFEIEPVDRKIDFSHGYTQLLLSKNQKKQLTALYSNLPSMMSANVLSQTYVVKFPEGLPHSLTQLKQGGYGTMIRGEHGRFVGSASLHPTISQASFVGIFSAMSIASGQYYLAEINKDLSLSLIHI